MSRVSIMYGFRFHACKLLLGWLAICAGCSAPEGVSREEAMPAQTEEALDSDNGLTPNGISTNGISTNGISTNGLALNGLTPDGLQTASFLEWFLTNPPEYADMVMRYLVRCALPSGQGRTWTHPLTSTTYTWEGNLGLTPDWASGLPITEVEQQLITACLAAHVNKYGLHVTISVRGTDAKGRNIPMAPGERTEFRAQEACFFGNLFTDDGVYSASDRRLRDDESTARACGLSAQAFSTNIECAPMIHVGVCSQFCTWDARLGYYTRCFYHGTYYKPLTTALRPADIYTCGDDTCQFTEHCGTGHTYRSCFADCGTCP